MSARLQKAIIKGPLSEGEMDIVSGSDTKILNSALPSTVLCNL